MEETLYDAHPSMFRQSPVGFIISIILIPFVLGLLILGIWFLRVRGTKLTITNERITLRQGILSKRTNEIYITDVRNVQVSQSLFQRMLNAGTIGISSAGQSGVEIGIAGMVDPEKIKGIIDDHRRKT